MREPSPQAREAARTFLAGAQQAAAEAVDVAHLTQHITHQLGQVMVRWIGAAGYAALLQRSLREAALTHPALRGLRLDEALLIHAAPHPTPIDGDTALQANVALLATFLDVLGKVAGYDMALSLAEQAFALTAAAPASDRDDALADPDAEAGKRT